VGHQLYDIIWFLEETPIGKWVRWDTIISNQKCCFFFNIFFMVKLFEIGIGSYGKIEMDTLALSKTCGCFQGK
jgi:hypothetical protein